MAYLHTEFLLWPLVLIQIAGLGSAWLARLYEGSRREASCQGLFLACLALMGASTLIAVSSGPKYWLACAATLSVMVLAAVWDFSPQAQPRRY